MTFHSAVAPSLAAVDCLRWLSMQHPSFGDTACVCVVNTAARAGRRSSAYLHSRLRRAAPGRSDSNGKLHNCYHASDASPAVLSSGIHLSYFPPFFGIILGQFLELFSTSFPL